MELPLGQHPNNTRGPMMLFGNNKHMGMEEMGQIGSIVNPEVPF